MPFFSRYNYEFGSHIYRPCHIYTVHQRVKNGANPRRRRSSIVGFYTVLVAVLRNMEVHVKLQQATDSWLCLDTPTSIDDIQSHHKCIIVLSNQQWVGEVLQHKASRCTNVPNPLEWTTISIYDWDLMNKKTKYSLTRISIWKFYICVLQRRWKTRTNRKGKYYALNQVWSVVSMWA